MNNRQLKTKVKQIPVTRHKNKNTCTNISQDTGGNGIPNEENNQTEIRTSAIKRTIIDYKKFLEEYADKPPLPPKKKREVDLKWKNTVAQNFLPNPHVVISVKTYRLKCQDDTFSRIELFPSIVLSSEKANYKNDIQ